MFERFGRGLAFIAGSIVGGLALPFVVVALRPDLIRRPAPAPVATPTPAETSPPLAVRSAAVDAPSAPGPVRVTYSDAVQRAAPAVVTVSTDRLVTERMAPSTLGELLG